MQTLTIQDVLRGIRRYSKNGKLAAASGHTDCAYIYDDGCRCAIGASLSDEAIQACKVDMMLNTQGILASCGKLSCTICPSHQNDISRLQSSHDEWADHNTYKGFPHSLTEGELLIREERRHESRKNFWDTVKQLRKKWGVAA